MQRQTKKDISSNDSNESQKKRRRIADCDELVRARLPDPRAFHQNRPIYPLSIPAPTFHRGQQDRITSLLPFSRTLVGRALAQANREHVVGMYSDVSFGSVTSSTADFPYNAERAGHARSHDQRLQASIAQVQRLQPVLRNESVVDSISNVAGRAVPSHNALGAIRDRQHALSFQTMPDQQHESRSAGGLLSEEVLGQVNHLFDSLAEDCATHIKQDPLLLRIVQESPPDQAAVAVEAYVRHFLATDPATQP